MENLKKKIKTSVQNKINKNMPENAIHDYFA